MEIQILAWDRHKYVAGLNWIMEFLPFSLDNCCIFASIKTGNKNIIYKKHYSRK